MSKRQTTWLAIRLAIVSFLFLLGAIIYGFFFAPGARLSIKDIVDILRGLIEIGALLVGAFWVLYKFYEYREFMDWIQLDIDKNLYKLSKSVDTEIYSWEDGKRQKKSKKPYTYAIEVILRFTNKGKTRVRLYNIQISIFTMSPPNGETKFEAKFNEDSGFLRLTRILTSGNIVPIMPVLDSPHAEAYLNQFRQAAHLAGEALPDDWPNQQLHDLKHEGPAKVLAKLQAIRDLHPTVPALQKTLAPLQKRAKGSKPIEETLLYYPIEETSFYYIEPGVQQEFTYLALIPQPQELLQVAARFNLEQKRMYPGKPDETIPEKIDETIRVKESRANKVTMLVRGALLGVVTKAIRWLFYFPRDKNESLYPHTVARTFQVEESVP